jgi:hypothetical protein
MDDEEFLQRLSNSAFVQIDEGQEGRAFWVLNVFGIEVFASSDEDAVDKEQYRLRLQLSGIVREAYTRGRDSTRS